MAKNTTILLLCSTLDVVYLCIFGYSFLLLFSKYSFRRQTTLNLKPSLMQFGVLNTTYGSNLISPDLSGLLQKDSFQTKITKSIFTVLLNPKSLLFFGKRCFGFPRQHKNNISLKKSKHSFNVLDCNFLS